MRSELLEKIEPLCDDDFFRYLQLSAQILRTDPDRTRTDDLRRDRAAL